MLSNERIYLRVPEPQDVGVLLRWENDSDNWQVSYTLIPFSKRVMEQYVNSAHDLYSQREVRFMIICKEINETVGAIDLFDFDPFHQRAGIGILIDKNQRKQGFAEAALTCLMNYAFTHLQLNSLYASVGENNPVSLHLFTKVGFECTGLRKAWIKTTEGYIDEHFLQLINRG
ncbi:MAG: GNAT family N-acetyltransferase [Flavobacteriales bacterium]